MKRRPCFNITLAAALILGTAAYAADEPITVNVDNFARAETDMQFDRMLKATKGVNEWGHNRLPTPLDKQNVIRMNRDTLYSFALVDISKGATVTMPDPGERYMSLMVINNDGYVNKAFHGGGTYKLTMEEFDTPFVDLAARTLVNAADDAELPVELEGNHRAEAVRSAIVPHDSAVRRLLNNPAKCIGDLVIDHGHAGDPYAENGRDKHRD